MRLVLLFWALASSLWAAEAVKFGFVLPLGTLHGKSYRDCAILAKEDYLARNLAFDFIFEDNNYESSRTNLITQKFLTVDKVDAIWSVWGLWANIVEPQARRHNVLHVSSAFDFDTKADSPSLNGAPQNEAEIELLLKYLKDNGLSKLSIVYIQESGLISWINRLKELAPSYGVEIVNDQMIQENQRDLRMVVMRVKESGADALWLDMWEPPLPIFVRQAKQLGLDIPMISRDDAYLTPEIASYFEGNVGISSALPSDEWVERFKERFGYVPICYAWIYYDQVRSLMEAYDDLYAKNGKIPTDRQLHDYLVGRHYQDGPLGETYYDENGRLVNKPALIKVVDAVAVPYGP